MSVTISYGENVTVSGGATAEVTSANYLTCSSVSSADSVSSVETVTSGGTIEYAQTVSCACVVSSAGSVYGSLMPVFVSSSVENAPAGTWFVCTSALEISLQAGCDGARIAVSTESSVNSVTITPYASETIRGSSSYLVSGGDSYAELLWNGVEWTVIKKITNG